MYDNTSKIVKKHIDWYSICGGHNGKCATYKALAIGSITELRPIIVNDKIWGDLDAFETSHGYWKKRHKIFNLDLTIPICWKIFVNLKRYVWVVRRVIYFYNSRLIREGVKIPRSLS